MKHRFTKEQLDKAANLKIKTGSTFHLNGQIHEQELSLKDFLMYTLEALWCEKLSFSVKKPLGFSYWDENIYVALIESGLVNGEVNNGRLISVEMIKADELVLCVIKSIFSGQ